MPVWMQRVYWYLHGPVTNPQPRGANYMGASGIIWFLVIEFVLACVIVLGLYGVDWLGAREPVNKIVKALIVVIVGAIMLIKLLNFAGAI
jgi:hypothetical protein